MYCPECGAYNPDDARFCGSCGAALPSTQNVTSTPTAPTKGATADTSVAYQAPYEPYKAPATANVAENATTEPARGVGVAPVASPMPSMSYGQPQNQALLLRALQKDSGIAILISFFLPGIGSIYGGDVKIGAVIFVVWLISWVIPTIGILIAFGLWIYGMIHAYQTAIKYNAFVLQNGRKPLPNELFK